MIEVVTANEVTRESKFGDLKPGSVVDVTLPISAYFMNGMPCGGTSWTICIIPEPDHLNVRPPTDQ